jgi:hypothetical protein
VWQETEDETQLDESNDHKIFLTEKIRGLTLT